MTWAYFDDGAPKHPKAVNAGNEAWCLWAAAVMYCNRWLTDGYVTLAALATDCLPVPISKAKAKSLAAKLCEAKQRPDGVGLFEPQGDGSYLVHDFLDWNKSKAEVEAKRAADRARKKTGGTPPPPPPPPPPSSRPASEIPPDSNSDSARNSERSRNGKSADSSPPARARAGASQPSPAQPSPPQPADLTSQPDPILTARSAPPGPSQGLAGRVQELGFGDSGEPKPRHDPIREKLAFTRWWPSTAILTWARDRGLSDDQFDAAIGDVRAKTNGAGDIGWWDRRVISFLGAAITRHGVPEKTADQLAAEAHQRELNDSVRKKRERLIAETLAAKQAAQGGAAPAGDDPVGSVLGGIG